MRLSEYEVAEDLMIDGLKVIQDTRLYRFTSDSVLLSRFARAKRGDNVADFCAGSGIVAFHFYALNRAFGLRFTLFEMQKELSELSEKTIALTWKGQIGKVEKQIEVVGKTPASMNNFAEEDVERTETKAPAQMVLQPVSVNVFVIQIG